MKNRLITLIIFLFSGHTFSQAGDIGTPADTPFSLGGDIQGTIQNSVNEVTGKVTFSAPLGAVAASSVSYGINLTYNGQASFKNGQQTNKYNPTSVVGVGWSFNNPKIVVDNKSTGTRDDDVFYLQDGATNSKLICIDRGTTSTGSVWKFQMEKYAPWVIEFHYSDLTNYGDYWKIIKEDGLAYYFGDISFNTNETVVRYGNWIGSSNQSGTTTRQTIVWNIRRIEDQWNNYLNFEYDKVNQIMDGKEQTEAAYLKKVISSNGANIQLIYAAKNSDEYYEPHQEMAEPDAYQERYEKKYLQSVSSYNNENELVFIYNLGYTLNGTGLNKKRYLTSLTQTAYNNGQNEALPAQTFDYHYTGIFKGGIKTITYPAGGSVTYNYNNKFLFNNTFNLFETAFTVPTGYEFHTSYVSDNYIIQTYRTTNKISGDKYRWKFFRFWWNGQKWEQYEFTFPHLMEELPGASNNIKDFYAVLERDFYGFVYDKGSTADVYLFHLKKDGLTWNYYSSTNRNIGGSSNNSDHFPSFISGDEFAALSSKPGGQLYTYTWNGTGWNYELINQGSGEYYVAATNNFILCINENGGTDMVTNVVYSNKDIYYIHYLDAEKNWQSKSWSSVADNYIGDIWITNNSPGYAKIFPSNSIAGLVIKDNPEFFLHWDTNYNLTNVEDIVGYEDDEYSFVPVDNSMFSLVDGNGGYNGIKETARFNGVGWKSANLSSANTHFGIDYTLSRNGNGSTYKQVIYQDYSPNSNSWISGNLISVTSNESNLIHGVNKDFIVARNKILTKSIYNPSSYTEIGNLWTNFQPYTNTWTYSDGLYHAFSILQNDNNGAQKAIYLYLDKNTGSLVMNDIGQKYYLSGNTQMGGRSPFMSPNTMVIGSNTGGSNMQIHRIIEDQLDSPVYDIVVNHIDINDDNGSLRKVQYTYNNPKCAPDNSATFYGEVIIENKGTGIGNIGKVVKVFNDGSEDLAMVGLPMETITIDANNAMVKKNTMTWQKFTKSSYNGTKTIDKSYYIRATKEKEELFFEDSPKVDSETTYAYNSLGLKTSATTSNSTGISEKQEITYAYQQYSFVNDKNMLAFPYQTTSKISNTVVNVEQAKWINDNGKAYINENWSGPTTSNLRLNSKISKVETTGNVLENNNGKGLYNSVLFGYENLYEVATIQNAEYQDVIDELDVTYLQLQSLTTANLKVELLKLYDRLPNASIELKFYDNNGRVISKVDSRREEVFIEYDPAGRLDYITDAQGKILEKKEYHFAN